MVSVAATLMPAGYGAHLPLRYGRTGSMSTHGSPDQVDLPGRRVRDHIVRYEEDAARFESKGGISL